MLQNLMRIYLTIDYRQIHMNIMRMGKNLNIQGLSKAFRLIRENQKKIQMKMQLNQMKIQRNRDGVRRISILSIVKKYKMRIMQNICCCILTMMIYQNYWYHMAQKQKVRICVIMMEKIFRYSGFVWEALII